MKQKEIVLWYKYIKALNDDEYFEIEDTRELVRLNHLVMELAHDIHNRNMLDDLPTIKNA